MFSVIATKKIHELANERSKGYEAAINGLVTALVVHILHLIAPKDVVHNESTSNLHLRETRETNIESFFLTNFSKDICIDSLAESLHLCPRRVNQLLQEYFGCSFSRKLNITRIEMAKNYLLSSENNISDVGRLCGYNSNNYFHILFKRSTGVSPKQYRNSLRGNNSK
jgi:YesN/AraC family two-component response regulator